MQTVGNLGKRRLQRDEIEYASGRPTGRVGNWSVGGRELGARLTDALQQCREPRRADVKRLAASYPVQFDGTKLVAPFLVVPDQAGLTSQGAIDREVGHGLDQGKITRIGGG